MGYKTSVNLPQDEKTYGAWVEKTERGKEPQDVHIYTQKAHAVIGSYKSYSDDFSPTDLAVGIGPDGKITFQYEKDGEVVIEDLTAAQFRKAVLNMLRELRKIFE